jgi:hypothetical protein
MSERSPSAPASDPRPKPGPVELADRALQERPAFSIRAQVYLSALFLFLIALAIAFTTTATGSRVEEQVRLFQVTSKLLFEIEQARRSSRSRKC